ncbi:BP74-related protein [Streptacidiphilus melanogenes]|uniref:BP74-related protein n=1 Tax=Streptacidiphilus melanogenes TaxID=411235 RepID=UPI003F6FB445
MTDITHAQFVIKLTKPEDIEHARELVSGETTDRPHVLTRILKRTAPYNPRWSYSADPEKTQFFDQAIEVCDATIPYVEEHLDEAGRLPARPLLVRLVLPPGQGSPCAVVDRPATRRPLLCPPRGAGAAWLVGPRSCPHPLGGRAACPGIFRAAARPGWDCCPHTFEELDSRRPPDASDRASGGLFRPTAAWRAGCCTAWESE